LIKLTISKFIKYSPQSEQKYCSYCFGVQNAIDIAKEAAKASEVFTYGDIVHNEYIVKKLADIGIKSSVDLPFLLDKKNVVIRAHGIKPQIQAQLEQGCKKVFDATCPYVKKTQMIVKKHCEKGFKIIILGNPKHAEVEGLVGYAGNDAIVIYEDSEVPVLAQGKYCLVAQTTFSSEKYEIIVKNIEKQVKDNTIIVVFFNTICYTTRARQIEAEELSKSNQLVFVLGSRISSNTLKLFDIANRFSQKAVLIESTSDLKSVDFNKYNTMAVLAAASAPQELIEEVLIYMSETQKAQVVSEETATAAAPAAEKAEITMEDIMASNKSAGFMTYKAGKRVTAEILNVDDTGIYVGIGGKKDGFIDKADASIGAYNQADFVIGEKVDAIIIPNKTKDYISLSKKDVDVKKQADAEAEKALQADVFELVCNEVVEGKGLRGKLGSYTVFVPASQIRIGFVKTWRNTLQRNYA
jgi:4-hydroxy-3-methylbut-2-enyl diphosphate reductase